MALPWAPSELRENTEAIDQALEILDSMLDNSEDEATIANRQTLERAQEALRWIEHYGKAY